ncbi:MAG: putative lipid II flippase FtsW [Planctomycetota bacterium]
MDGVDGRKGLLGTTGVLLAIGLVMIYSASSGLARDRYGDALFFIKRQMVWAAVAAVGAILVTRIPYPRLLRWSPVILGASLALLAAVLVCGSQIHGGRRWIRVGGIGFQPSEFAKIAMVLYLADIFSRKASEVHTFRFFVRQAGVAGVAFLLILLEPDFGTAVLLGGICFLMFFTGGVRLRYLAGTMLLALPALAGLVILYPYRMVRILAFLSPWKYARTIGYHVTQSIIGLGSGGFWGVGLGDSGQKRGYLPEPHGDFIFSILGEEMGLLGALAVMALFLYWTVSGMRVAARARNQGGYFLAFGLTSLVAAQALFNIAVVTSCLPAKGIALPLMSYGGSSLLFTLVAVGILCNIASSAPEAVPDAVGDVQPLPGPVS